MYSGNRIKRKKERKTKERRKRMSGEMVCYSQIASFMMIERMQPTAAVCSTSLLILFLYFQF
jgi:hypothetical protein